MVEEELEAPVEERDAVARLTRDRMAGAAELDGVALVVDVSTGPSWADLSPPPWRSTSHLSLRSKP